VSVDVLYDFEPNDAAWFSNALGVGEPDSRSAERA
jgi:hypothetical protein